MKDYKIQKHSVIGLKVDGEITVKNNRDGKNYMFVIEASEKINDFKTRIEKRLG